MITPRILLKGTFYPKDIEVTVSTKNNRKLDPIIESKIEKTWEETVAYAKEKGQLIFNGESFRLDDYVLENGKLKLTLSRLKYKDRSSLSRLVEELILKGEDYLPKGLAIGGFIKTKDNKFIFGNRSGKTVSYNTQDVIGGIFEPKEVNNGQDIFDYNFQEINEELGLEKVEIVDMKVLTLVLSQTGNIIIITSTILSITSEEVLEKFDKKEKEEYEEMSSLGFVERKDLEAKLRELGGYKIPLIEVIDQLDI